mmetsp:Transcript_126846/g.219640  ORF Transcript_126846/g.219640 Transcript_126846/m.219640 type:complete len:81 (+) Transcript_126846:23-265(+)
MTAPPLVGSVSLASTKKKKEEQEKPKKQRRIFDVNPDACIIDHYKMTLSGQRFVYHCEAWNRPRQKSMSQSRSLTGPVLM